MENQLIRAFVVGSPRSGTTLAQSILAAHPDIVGFTESHFFVPGFGPWPLDCVRLRRERLVARVEKFIELNNLNSEDHAREIATRIRDCSDVGTAVSLIVEMLDEEARSQGLKGWVDKTPDHVRRIAVIEKHCPDAKFIHIVRNPVNTMLSLRVAKDQWSESKRWLWMRCFSHWYCSLLGTLLYAKNPSHKIVFFEDVTAHPEDMSRQMTEWLNLEWSPEILNERIDTSRSLVRKDEKWKANNFKPIEKRPDRDPRDLPFFVRIPVQLNLAYSAIRRWKRALHMHPTEQHPTNSIAGAPETTAAQSTDG